MRTAWDMDFQPPNPHLTLGWADLPMWWCVQTTCGKSARPYAASQMPGRRALKGTDTLAKLPGSHLLLTMPGAAGPDVWAAAT